VSEAPDPLGKRALFWAPAERDESGPRRPTEVVVAGKHALFSPEARQRAANEPNCGAGVAAGVGPTRRAGLGPTLRRGGWDRVSVSCSSCAHTAEIHVTEFALLHLPLWMWWPGRGYTRFMTCPSCRRRTWVRATWAPLAR